MLSVSAQHERAILSQRDEILRKWNEACPTPESKKEAALSEMVVTKLAMKGARAFALSKTNRWTWDPTCKKLILIIREKDGTLHLIRIDDWFGAGNYGIVYRAKSIFDKKALALKVSLDECETLEKDVLKEELRIYQKIYPDQPMGSHLTGLQRNCLQVLLTLPKFSGNVLSPRLKSTGKRELSLGFVMPFYHFGTLHTQFKFFTTANTQHKSASIYHILLGQAYLQNQNMAHLDLFPTNCFRIEEGIDLGDLGGVIDFGGEKIRGFPLRTQFAYLAEYTKLRNEQDKEKLASLIIKNATLQSALLIHMLFKGQVCYPYSLKEFWTGVRVIYVPDTIDPEIKKIDWLFKMLDPDTKKRPSPKEALLDFHHSRRDLDPLLYAKFNQEVNQLCKDKEPYVTIYFV